MESLASYISHFQSCACASLMWGSLLFAARRIARRMLRDETMCVQLCGTGIFAISIAVMTAQVLGVTGLLSRWPVAMTCVGWAVLVSRLTKCDLGRSDATECVAWFRRRITDGYALTVCIFGVMVFQALTRAMRCPPLSWDSLTYHAFLPARWTQLGRISAFAAPGGMDGYRAMPFNLELLATYMILPFGNDLCLNMINPLMMLLCALAGYSLARHLGASERIATWASLFFCFSPATWSLVTTQYNDILVAGVLGCCALYLVRFLNSRSTADLILTSLSAGLACGTKFTSVPVAVAVALGVMLVSFVDRRPKPSERHVEVDRQSHRRRQGTKHLAGNALIFVALASSVGAYKYVENWLTLDNPVYPVEVKLAGRTLFEGSPMQSEVLASMADARRASDWQVAKYVVAAREFTWGPKFIALAVLTVLFLLIKRARRRDGIVLVLLVIVYALPLSLPQDGLAELTRRAFADSFCRMLGFPALVCAAMAVAMVSRFRIPRGLVPAVPTLTLVLDWRFGRFPQPPSFNEIVAVTILILVVAGLIAWPTSIFWSRIRRSRAIAIPVMIGIVAICPAIVGYLQTKRDNTRYIHYGSSVDFHDFPRALVQGWRACDETDSPHTIAYVRRHKPDAAESMHHINTRWFFYPLLGAHLQNRVVYASIHEVRDLPTKPFLAALYGDPREDAWIENLRRLNVDRLFLTRGADPEEKWIAKRAECFRAISAGEDYMVFSVDPTALKPVAALASGTDSSEYSRPSQVVR